MQPDSLFLLLNFGVLVPWALLILAPRTLPSRVLLTSAWPPMVLGVLYVAVMLLAPMPPGGADLPSIQRVLGSPWGATAMWIHAITFDLFVGGWIVRDAQRHGIRHWMVAPCLALVLFFGPGGALAYLALRLLSGRGTSLQESAAVPPS